jgi:hypothetical protein
MNEKNLTSEGHDNVMRRLRDDYQERRRHVCVALQDYILTPEIEAVVRNVATSDGIASVRRAARKTLLRHWSRSRQQGLKMEAEQIKQHLTKFGISTFYHLTAKANLDSIYSCGGLFSRAELSRRGINPICIADRSRDDTCGTDEWIHLSFHANQPMYYRLIPKKRHSDFLIIEINTDVALRDSTVFSDMNAVASYARIGPNLSDLQSLALNVFAHDMFTPESKAQWQAEVLVHPMVSVSAITNVKPYADVLKQHQDRVPMGAKIDYLNRRFEV